MTAERARTLAREIATYGGLEPAIAALAHDQAFRVLDDALAYRTLCLERGDPGRRIDRLLSEAADLEARAGPAWVEAAEWHGRAAFRRARGDVDVADRWLGRALAVERTAAGYEEQAFRKRLQAAELKADGALCDVLRELAA
jgi:hypothetical protein